MDLTILNFFTRSAYAPYAPDSQDVSALRAAEDRRSAKAVDARIQIRTLELLDAPLRLPIDFGSVTNPEAFAPVLEEVICLSRVIRFVSRRSLVLAPLSLGDHIDHRTVHQAALGAECGKSLGFYEDLPYATWTSEESIRERVEDAEKKLLFKITPVLQRPRSWRFKEHVSKKYQSQIDDAMARSIARYSGKYRGAERIWVPRHSRAWTLLTRF